MFLFVCFSNFLLITPTRSIFQIQVYFGRLQPGSERERKKNPRPLFASSVKRCLREFHEVVAQWRRRDGEMYEKVWCTFRVVLFMYQKVWFTWRVAVLLIKPTDFLTFRFFLNKALYWALRAGTLLVRKRVAIRKIFMNWESNRDVCSISKALNAVLTRINVNIFIVIYQLFLRW